MHHLIELLTNPWIMIPVLIIFFGEYIPFTKFFWQKIGLKLKSLGEWFLSTYENKIYSHKEEWIEDKKVQLKLNNFFARIFFFAISTIIVIFLEIVWELGFKGLTRKLEGSKIALWSEQRIKKLPNWAVLLVFGTPFIFMEIIGILSLGAFVSGNILTGIGLYLFKVLFFIPVHFVLHVGKDQLMGINWFKRRYDIIIGILNWFKRSQSYVKVHNISETIKAHINAIKHMFVNTVILLKKAFEHDDILSPECEQVRQEILEYKKANKDVVSLYEKFFNCVNSHLQSHQKESTTQKKH